MTVFVDRAQSRATLTGSPVRPPESTPRTVASAPAIQPISPAFPFKIAISSSSRSFRVLSVRSVVAPAPTGSSTIGIPHSLARFPAQIIAAIWSRVSVPILRTRAPAILTISATSSAAFVMTGAAPMQRVIFAQSLIVTSLVIWCTRGPVSRTR